MGDGLVAGSGADLREPPSDSGARAFTRRWADRRATDAAMKLATGRFGTVGGGRRDAAWRVREDGVVELVRAHSGRVDLFEVLSDGSSHRIATSPVSKRKQLAAFIEVAGIGCFVLAFILGFLIEWSFMALWLVWPVLAVVAAVMKGRSDVWPWIEGRFGSRDGWVRVPWKIHGAPTTGNQVITLGALAADRNKTYYRVLAGGDLEVAAHGKPGQLLVLDSLGAVTSREDRPKRTPLSDLRGRDVVWHRIYSSDPDE